MLYFNLLTSGKLYEHLAEIDTSACNMAEYLIKEMARKQGATEELKATDMVMIPLFGIVLKAQWILRKKHIRL